MPDNEDLHVSDTETACAFACHDGAASHKCMKSEFTPLDLHDAGTVAQLDMPRDTLDVEG